MTREEAAEFTRKLVARAETIVFPKTPKTINNIPVFYFEAVLSALRGPEWVRTADRLPTEEDAIEVHDEWGFTHKEVAVLSSGWPFEALVKDIPAMLPGIMDIETIENKTTTFPYWMPLPKPPEVEG